MSQPGRPAVVYTKNQHARWRLSTGHQKVHFLVVPPVLDSRGRPHVYTGGMDGTLRIWDGKDGRLLMKVARLGSNPLTAGAVSARSVCLLASSHLPSLISFLLLPLPLSLFPLSLSLL